MYVTLVQGTTISNHLVMTQGRGLSNARLDWCGELVLSSGFAVAGALMIFRLFQELNNDQAIDKPIGTRSNQKTPEDIERLNKPKHPVLDMPPITRAATIIFLSAAALSTFIDYFC